MIARPDAGAEAGDPAGVVLGSVVGLGRALRAAGIVVSVGQLEAFTRAFAWLDPLRSRDVYHAALGTLLTRHADRPVFDRVFSELFGRAAARAEGPRKMPLAPRHNRHAEQPALATLLAQRAHPTDPEVDVRDRSRSASDNEHLRRKDFALMSELELDAVRRLMARRRWDFATRVTRRLVRHRRGQYLDLRRAVARAARAGGALVELPRRRPRIKRRPIVVLADVSGSMELYTRVLLQFFHALGHGFGGVESFVFATRLTRVTLQMGLRNVDEALSEVSSSVLDFASGTRIGESVGTFNRQWSGRALGRGAVVIVVSDGWERGSPELLGKEMRVLRDRCHRLIWLNPRLGERRYEPKVGGMAAALEHVDDFLPCHDLQSLEALAVHLSSLSRRRSVGPALSPAVAMTAAVPAGSHP